MTRLVLNYSGSLRVGLLRVTKLKESLNDGNGRLIHEDLRETRWKGSECILIFIRWKGEPRQEVIQLQRSIDRNLD